MERRVVLAAIGALSLVLVGLCGFLGYAYFGNPGAGAVSVGGPFTLVDGDGKTVTDQDFRGKWLLVYFGYTHCPDACPTALNDIAVTLDKLGARKADVRPVFITVDPERDTSAVMKDYVAAFDAPITGLTGTSDQLAEVEHEYRVYAAKHPTEGGGYDMDHSSIIYLMDPDGRFVTAFTHENSPEEMAAKLRQLIS